MGPYYSQSGEDFILDQMFAGKTDGFFVEVGCIDGKRFSNTLHFEQKGWKGMCIEAHPDYIPLLRENRPGSLICHCAVAEADQDSVTFYANKRGSLSTLDKSQEERWRRDYAKYFHGFDERQVPMRRLATIFRENNIERIDILSIDIEGYEVNALKGLDFSVTKPLVMVIESDNESHEREIESVLLPQGYIKSVRVSGNLFFVLDSALHERVRNKVFKGIKIIHTRHPLDDGDDQIKIVDLTTIQPAIEPHPLAQKGIFQRFIEKTKRIFSFIPDEIGKTEKPMGGASRFIFFDTGFHGDKYLLELVDVLAQNVDVFVETGANVASTLVYFACKYPHISCFSCEPYMEAFRHARQNVAGCSNVTLYHETSQDFLFRLQERHPGIFQQRVLFWLDAHGYGFKWPLKEELSFITEKFPQALILIDDFKVPGKDMFGYDAYEGQVCSYEYIKDSLNPAHSYRIYYPNYTEHTSKHHPLRGWGLIVYGGESMSEIPATLSD